ADGHVKRAAEAAHPDDAVHAADHVARLGQHGTLLDMRLDERGQVAATRLADPRGVEVAGAHRLADRDAVLVDQALHLVRLDGADDGPAAPEVGHEAARLLLAVGEELESRGWPAPRLREPAHGTAGHDNARNAVIGAAPRHRVNVRARQHHPFVGARKAAVAAAHGIRPDFQTTRREPLLYFG